jgi:aspartate racemase
LFNPEMSFYTNSVTGDSSLATRHPPLATPIIGLVGGVGPFAGLDLQRKILDQTVAARDQDYLPVISVSWPGPIPDRTEYLLGRVVENPAYPILEQLRLLAVAGATVAGIPCNTAHAPAIFDVIRAGLTSLERPLRLLHMIDETAAYLAARQPTIKTVGVLSTTGTWRARLYPTALGPRGWRVVAPDETLQEEIIHPAVYSPDYGIKAAGRVTQRARADLELGVAHLRERGAEAIILGCTEISLAFPEREYKGLPLIDPTLALARGLVREIDPSRLKKLD